MILYDRILGFIWLFLGLAFCLLSYRIDLGEVGSPGPGFVPFLSGCLLILLSAIYLIKSLFFPTDSQRNGRFWEGIRWDKSVLVVASLFAYILFLPILGYLIVTFLFLVFLGKLIELKKWWTILVVSSLSTGISFLIFNVWLKCQFPKGLFNL